MSDGDGSLKYESRDVSERCKESDEGINAFGIDDGLENN